jgi:catechol 2,3-dioxygenase-like lactoylglutathione lyase family enzyme
MTRFPVPALRSAEIETPDLEQSLAFYTGPWRLDLVERRGGSAWLRATGDDPYVLALHEGPSSALRSVTFRAAAQSDLSDIAMRAEGAGCRVIAGPAPTDEPGGGTLLSLHEPQGGTVRLVHGDRRHDDACSLPDLPLRLAHVNINSVDVDAEARFYEQVLGFRLTDRSKLMAFLRCNSDHHAVVLAEAPVNGLNHVAFLVPDWESVMRAAGRLIDHGHGIGWGIGRHGPGDNVFAYFVDPLGIVVEYTAEVLQVDDSYVVRGPSDWTWPPGRTDQWGIAPPKAEHVKKAQLAILHASASTRSS